MEALARGLLVQGTMRGIAWIRQLGALATFAVAVGCAGDPEEGGLSDDLDGTPEEIAQQFFDREIHPRLEGACATCHVSGVGVRYLVSDDWRADLLAYPGMINLADPDNSRILTKGRHEGPSSEWTPTQKPVVREWIGLEAAAAASP